MKDVLAKKRMQRELLRARGLLAEAEKPPEEETPAGAKPAGGLPAAPKPGSYVPPSVRNRCGFVLDYHYCSQVAPCFLQAVVRLLLLVTSALDRVTAGLA